MRDLTKPESVWNPKITWSRCFSAGRVLICLFAGLQAVQSFLVGVSYLMGGASGLQPEEWSIGGWVVLSNPFALAIYAFFIAAIWTSVTLGIWRRSCLGWWGVFMFTVWIAIAAADEWSAKPFALSILLATPVIWLVIRRERSGLISLIKANA